MKEGEGCGTREREEREGEREREREREREKERITHLLYQIQASLCTVDIDSGKVEFPDELPCLPNEDRLLVQVSEKLHQHDVSCSDRVDLPHSPDSTNLTPQKPSIIEAIRYIHVHVHADAVSIIYVCIIYTCMLCL